jgi:hypothetical protein
MDVQIVINGAVAVKMEINVSLISTFLRDKQSDDSRSPVAASTVPRSTPMNKVEIEETLSRIDPKSAQFLRQIAANGGMITWGKTRAIFGIKEEEDWAAFAGSYGKGITRVVRHLLKDKSARLVWWDDLAWENSEEWDPCEIYVDGPALEALREVAEATST